MFSRRIMPHKKCVFSFSLAFFAVANQSTLVATAFGPCPPPRFDEFSERLIGSWTTSEDSKLTVEEVMRSCGGAVQGIQEPLGKDGETFYLNRANDGFVFYDHGCYTCGPVNRKDNDFYLSNLMVGKCRIVLCAEADQDLALSDPTALFQRKTFGTTDEMPSIHLEQEPLALHIDFSSKIKCCMPAVGQPWMLQRAKWEREKAEVPDVNDSETNEEDKSAEDDLVHFWSSSQTAEDFYDWAGLSGTKETGTVLQMGTACETTNAVSVVARHYNSNNALCSVLFLEGKLN